jgi:uncharacterized protein
MKPAGFAFAVLLALCSLCAGAAEVPFLSGRVVDDAGLLSAESRARISAQLKAHEDKTTNQVVVLTTPTLDGESIEPFAIKVFEKWKPGRKGKDNGAILIIVPKERKLRIEVGYGLEGTLTDAASSRIIRNVIAPHYKAGNFDKGTEEGVAAIVALLEGNASDTPQPDAKSVESRGILGISEPKMSLGERLLFGAFIFGIIGLFTVIGVITPGMGWFLYVFLIPFWALFPIVVVGVKGALVLLAIYLVAFPAVKLWLPRTQWYQNRNRMTLAERRAARRRGYDGVTHSGGSWTSSGGSWGSGSSGGGGFSGEGGFSGGGGSSGDF